MPLSRAICACLVRRALAAAGRSPALAVAALALLLGLPPLLHRAATVAAAELGPALARPDVARAALIGAALPCVAAGLALSASGLGGPLGEQLASAPAHRLDRAVAALVPLLTTFVALALPVSLAVCLPFAAASPGGLAAAPVMLVALGGVVSCAAAGATALRLACSRDGALARGGLALAAGVLVTGLAAPLEPAARALAGTADANQSLLPGVLAALAGLLAWVVLGESVVPQHEGRGGSVAIASRPRRAIAQAALLLLVRRRDLRSVVVGAFVIACAGLAVAMIEDAPPPTGALLAATGAAIALAPVGLALGGAALDGREVWQLVPRAGGEVALGWVLASLAVIGSVGALVVVLAVTAGAMAPADAPRLLAICIGAWACAVAAGALVPWSRRGVGEQAISLGAFGLLLATVSVVAGRIGPWATDAGVPVIAVGGVLIGVLIAGAFGGLTAHVVRRPRC